MTEPQRRELHTAAARLRHAEGGDPAVVAAHLIKTDTAAGRWVIASLRVATDQALARGAPEPDVWDPLRQGMEIAHRCGATALEERARTELEASGARPRSVVVSGVDSLTPSELRVAELAAQGMTNREIAQRLFVTMKTVETHLGHCYQKLDIAGRSELSSALGQPGSAQ
jgi:DNA-binding NarL/FixJ family response regulator